MQRKQAAWRPASREVSGGLSEKVKLKTKPEGGGGSGPEGLVRLSGVPSQGQVQSSHRFLPYNLRVVGFISALYFELATRSIFSHFLLSSLLFETYIPFLVSQWRP